MSDEQGFKRINFFKGFVTTTKDWNDAELYHVEKRKLHNRCFHGAGIVSGFRQEINVRARNRGDLSIEISPGYAIDGQGNDILLWETEIKTINKGDYKLPLTIYVVAKYIEEFTDFVAYKENLDFKGHRRILEKTKLDFVITEPDIQNEVELARIHLTQDAKTITDAKIPDNPGDNEIDLRYRPYAGVVGGYIRADLDWRLRNLLRALRRFFGRMAREKKVIGANAVALALMTLEMLREAGLIGAQNVMGLLRQLADLEWDVVTEIEATKPTLKAKKDFGQFKNAVEVLRNLLEENPDLLGDDEELFENLEQILGFQERGSEALGKVSGDPAVFNAADSASGGSGLLVDGKPVAGAALAASAGGLDFESLGERQSGEGLEEIKALSGDMPESITVDGIEWTLIDMIDILDRKSEQAHNFQVVEARDSWRTRQRIRYPDGTIIEDTGLAHEGGYAAWNVLNVTPHRPLMILRRMDFVRGDYEIEYFVNEKRVGVSVCPGSDRKYRWRNWPFIIPPDFVAADRLTVRQVANTAERDVNMFKLWFFQAL